MRVLFCWTVAPASGCRRRAAMLAVALAVTALATGCAVFPQGSYWPSLAARRTGAGPMPQAEPRPVYTPAATEAEAAARRAALQDAITRRWSGEDLARSARRMEGLAGRAVYADVAQTIVWFYVEPITYRRLVVAGLESLRAALENPTFRQRFPKAGDETKRRRYAEALDVLVLKAATADPWFAFQAADWLAVAMEKNTAMLGLPDGAIVGEFLFGAMDSLDAYSHYMTPEMMQVYREAMSGAYVGIGAEITAREGRIFIKHLFEGGGAAVAGLKAGDEITAVDGHAVAAMTLSETGRRLRGREGTTVTLSVRTGGEGELRDVAVQRRRIHLPAARDAQWIDEPRGIAYVRLSEFQDGAADELRRAIDGLAARGAKALVLDLRDNPGGSLIEAVEAAGLFLPGGRVLETRGRMLGATWTYDVPLLERQAWRGPLAVLTNEATASAAEIVASALSHRGRATVVGRRTFGKGAVQICFPVDWGRGAVCLTMARVYDAKGQCVDGRGVSPARDAAPASAPPATLADDPVVCAAVEVLQPPVP